MSGPATHDDVARLAYDLWIERGRPSGSPELDWERAERLLDLRLSAEHQPHTPTSQDTSAASTQLRPPVPPVQEEVVTGKSARVVKGGTRMRVRKVPGAVRGETAP